MPEQGGGDPNAVDRTGGGAAPARASRRPSRRAVLLGAAGVVVAGAAVTGVASATRRPAAKGKLVPALLKAHPFTIAHHGGSDDWPEESLYAYSRADAAGVDALEVSLARTSDGVWFGLHDATLDRTSRTRGFVAAEHTWREVQQYRISATGTRDPAQPSRPYARFEDILDEYGDSHALFVDPKVVTASHYPALFAMIEKRTAHPADTLVAKGYCSQVDWAREARKRGYQSWGYYYANEIAAKPDLLSSTQLHWSLLGLNYLGEPSQWTVMKALGKPIIGHVIPTLSAARTALDLGAQGLMISGVAATVGHLAASAG